MYKDKDVPHSNVSLSVKSLSQKNEIAAFLALKRTILFRIVFPQASSKRYDNVAAPSASPPMVVSRAKSPSVYVSLSKVEVT